MAPELLRNEKYSIKADMYSFALVMWEIIEQKRFFEEFKFNSQVEIEVVNHNRRPEFSSKVPEFYQEIISKCWDSDASVRYSAADILQKLENFVFV